MTITKQYIADEFLAAAAAAGLKKVMVLVGRLNADQFVVTITLRNPVAFSEDDQFIVNSWPYEFIDANDVRQMAAAKAAMFARIIPTIH